MLANRCQTENPILCCFLSVVASRVSGGPFCSYFARIIKITLKRLFKGEPLTLFRSLVLLQLVGRVVQCSINSANFSPLVTLLYSSKLTMTFFKVLSHIIESSQEIAVSDDANFKSIYYLLFIFYEVIVERFLYCE